MSYPTLQDDIKWLRFQAEASVLIDGMIGGTTDIAKINRGRQLLVVNTDPFGDVYCWYTKIENLQTQGVEGIAKAFATRVKEHRKNQP